MYKQEKGMNDMRRVEYTIGLTKTTSYAKAMEVSKNAGLPIVTELVEVETSKPALAPQAKKRLALI